MAVRSMFCWFTMTCCRKTIHQELKKAWNLTVWIIMMKGYWRFATGWNRSSQFVFIDRNWNSEYSRLGTRIGIWLALLSTLTQSHVTSNHYESLQKFQGGAAFSFGSINSPFIQIFLRNSFFSISDIHIFLYWLIERSQVNQMFITTFWFHSKLAMDKTK